ncbi:putative exporter [Robbsia andropogonis]|uniref:MMPL family transporter n=1 Tax=Robbsia andropogonis TaxID=28092 RepID=UPI003D1C29BA
MMRDRRRRAAWRIRVVWIALAACAIGFAGWRFWVVTDPAPLQTDLLALLPGSATDPAVDHAIDRLTDAVGQRVVFLVEADDPAQARAAAQTFADVLTQAGGAAPGRHSATTSPLFTSVIAKLPAFDLSRVGATYLPFRFGLLTAADRAKLQRLDGAVAPVRQAAIRQWLDARLYAPEASAGGGALQASLADDPFGWLTHWLSALPLAQTRLQLDHGFLVTHPGTAAAGADVADTRIGVLLFATLAGSPYATQTQQALIEAVASGEAALRRQHVPGLSLARFGAVFYAEAARASAQREVHLIGLASLAGIALLMVWVFRSPRLLLLGFLSTALGVLFAIDITLAIFGQLHLLTLVFGASLIGEAVDYSIQYFVAYFEQGAAASGIHDDSAGGSARENTPARRAARVVRPALTVALATSLLGYAVLAAVPFPVLRQIACFAFAGIATAFLCVLTLLPTLMPRLQAPRAASRTALFARAGRGLTWAYRMLQAGRVWPVVVILMVLAAPGWCLLHSDDDIHLLVQRDPRLLAQETRIRNALGSDDSTQFFLVRGRDDEAVLQGMARLDALLHEKKTLPSWQSLTAFLPPAGTQRADAALLDRVVFDDPAVLRHILIDAGLRDDVIDRWLAAHAASEAPASDGALVRASEMAHGARPVLQVRDWLAAPWSQPYAHLWLGALGGKPGEPATPAAVMPLQGVSEDNVAALREIAAQAGTADIRVVFVDKARSVSALFGAYRVRGAFWLLGVSVLILGLLSWRYGVGGAGRVLLPTALSVGVVLAAFGYLHQLLTLFNVLALMLVFGVGVNYAVFLREGCMRLARDAIGATARCMSRTSAEADVAADSALGAVWVGVLLSAATTFLSFGLLACSAMPALRSFGLTLSIGIGVAVMLSPLGMPFDPARRSLLSKAARGVAGARDGARNV